MVANKVLVMAAVPNGMPIPGQDLKIIKSEVDISKAPSGGLILQNLYLSYDPYQRGKMRDPKIQSYTPGYQINEPISNAAISKVIKSSTPRFQEGDVVIGMGNFEEYSVIEKERAEKDQYEGGFSKLENPLGLDEKIFLGGLGMSGLTAYSSLYAIGQPKKGETIFISAASGAVGQIVGQLAKREGLTVLGSVGSDEKLKFIIEELGFDSGFNYKKEKPGQALARLAPNGIDIYYDNVSGEQLDASLEAMKDFGRIIACGNVSQTSVKPEDAYGLKNMRYTVSKRLRIRGFIVFDQDMGPVYKDEHQKNMQKWIKDGEIKIKMSVTEGIDNAAEGLVGMLKGENFGKAILKV
ncbi:hypothetical protein BP6252_06390 [Coleophoma cylindrospora]|uniref:Enoyl reductase (ER) domain-containing protein n=1 Tax=Coleophoma cylindrospora TaxID=1849047 RepID=A0A3D8RMS6_9HELO|nr:hypothetical protein BP6252_06390 [Coleophoma cylindrospora]